MFGGWKERIISVGKNLRLFPEGSTRRQEPTASVDADVRVKETSGAQILTHFQEQWKELHALNEDNASSAAVLAEGIANVHGRVSRDHRYLMEMTQLLSNGAGGLARNVEGCVAKLAELAGDVEGAEAALLRLENLIETLELQEKQLEHRFQLALYKERKLGNLENLRVELAARHAQSIIEHECRQKQQQQERQQAFQDAFQTDLKTYQEVGHLPKIEKATESEERNSSVLEDIQLDYDSQALNQFLNQ